MKHQQRLLRITRGFGIALAIYVASFTPINATEQQMNICAPQSILITNSSSHWVSILGVRWLDEASNSWIVQPINNEYIRQNKTLDFTVTPWGIADVQTFYQVKYKFLQNEDRMEWSEIKTSSQVHVPDCRVGDEIEIKIADLR
jgi:hypothetical protein